MKNNLYFLPCLYEIYVSIMGEMEYQSNSEIKTLFLLWSFQLEKISSISVFLAKTFLSLNFFNWSSPFFIGYLTIAEHYVSDITEIMQ